MIGSVVFTVVDWCILVGYFLAILGLGFAFYRRNNSADQFTAAGGTLPGWLCGLSIFATYLSSISYLALPGKAFSSNWNAFGYSLALPVAAAISVHFFVPLYRRRGEVSAYSLLEQRFGLWARIFASLFYLLFHIARIGVVMYLMALPLALLFGWSMQLIILITGILVTAYAFVGGIVAVIWADAIQAIVLLGGALLALAILLSGMPEGASQVFELAKEDQKFSLGSTEPFALSQPTIWVVLAFGLFDNLRNFGIDQSYVQRYIAASSDGEAAKSVWLGALLYVPVSALFFFIGTALFSYYQVHPEEKSDLQMIVASQQADLDATSPLESKELASKLTDADLGDRVFPHFIASQLPIGARGLLIAAIFAAAMSTVSTSLNSCATLVMSDFYSRLINPNASEHRKMWVLRSATVVWGLLGTSMALLLIQLTASALDVWWLLSSVLGAAVVGLFLLGLILPNLRSWAAIVSLGCACVVIAWLVISQSDFWPEPWKGWASPFHSFLVIVIGPLVIIAIGCLLSVLSTKTQASLDNGFTRDQ